MPKILFYNWVQFDNKKNNGGGVNVYLKNLISHLYNENDYEITFLSSGWKYNPLKKGAYIEKSSNSHNDKINSFEIINSPVMAPSYTIFNSLEKYLNEDETLKLFVEFINEKGPFDIIHIHNIEGISVNVLKLKEIFPEIKIILSIHNYQPICPLVQYFQNHNNCICNDFHNGQECLSCLSVDIEKKEYCRRYTNYLLDKIPDGILPIITFPAKVFSKLFMHKTKDYINLQKETNPQIYKKYREYNVEMINKYVDTVLAVSNRVAKILEENGIDKTKIRTSYIGTKFADNAKGYSIAKDSNPFTIAYLGYERIDKGYFFLLDALEQLDKDIAAKINVVLAVKKIHTKLAYEKLQNFNNIKIYNGYTHKELPEILSDVNLGIVPVLWEDNLPQVAIEMAACGVPVLSSDFGGASELCSSELFKFKGADESDFLSHLTKLVKQPELLRDYWNNHCGLMTMDRHAKELEKYYHIDKKISVIIPVYNVEAYLEECLKSVCSQTLKDIEIILVDDGSTDSSLSICKEYEQKDKRIKILTQKNKGAGTARNKGLSAARGEYLSILDSDDFFELDLLEKLYKKAKQTASDIVVCNMSHYDDKEKSTKIFEETIKKCFIPSKSTFNYKDFPDYIFNCFQNWAWNKLFKTEFIKKNNINFQEIQRTNDLYFTCCALVLADKISYLDERLIYYRFNTSDSLQASNYKAPKDFAKAFIKLKNFLEKKNIYNKVKKSYINSALSGCAYNLHTLEKHPKEYKILLNYLLNHGFKKMDITEDNWNLFYSEYCAFKKILNSKIHYKNIFQRIFSIKNSYDKKFKIITILGIRVKNKKRRKYA